MTVQIHPSYHFPSDSTPPSVYNSVSVHGEYACSQAYSRYEKFIISGRIQY